MTLLQRIWPGSNRFYCNDRIMLGPIQDIGPNLYSWLTIITIFTFYCIFVMPGLMKQIPFVAILIILLFFNTLFFLIATSFTDPGIIPRKFLLKELKIDTPFEQIYQVYDENNDSNFNYC